MKLKDFFIASNIFSLINTIEPLPFFADGKAELINKIMVTKYGQRVIYDEYLFLSLADLAAIIHLEKAESWKNLVLIANSNFDLTKGAQKVTTETVVNNDVLENVSNSANKVASYDSDIMSATDGNDKTETTTNSGNKTITKSDGSQSLNSAYYNLSLLDKNNIIEKIIYDVVQTLTLNIY